LLCQSWVRTALLQRQLRQQLLMHACKRDIIAYPGWRRINSLCADRKRLLKSWVNSHPTIKPR
jgi:hypothetical protein